MPFELVGFGAIVWLLMIVFGLVLLYFTSPIWIALILFAIQIIKMALSITLTGIGIALSLVGLGSRKTKGEAIKCLSHYITSCLSSLSRI